MRLECDIIRDLLPLYVEQLASEASRSAVEEHLAECGACRELCQGMMEPQPRIEYDREPAESFHRYVKKNKRKLELKGMGIAAAVILLILGVRMAAVGGAIAWLAADMQKAEIYEDTDVSHYLWYMGEDAKEEYVSKWGMDESIFPGEITQGMNVTDYRMVYYDPWDAQYLSCLVAEYEEGYEAEVRRLQSYDSKSFRGYFGAEGFAEGYELLAMEAHPDFGLIYALAGKDREIVYVELVFGGLYLDLDYQSMIRPEYLPMGFDATRDNPYRQQRLGRD